MNSELFAAKNSHTSQVELASTWSLPTQSIQRNKDISNSGLRAALHESRLICVQQEREIRQYQEAMATAVAQIKYLQEQLAVVEHRAQEPIRTTNHSMPFNLSKYAKPTMESAMKVYMLGQFHVDFNNRIVTDWPCNKAKTIFKYLVLKRTQPIAENTLVDLFWPNSPPAAALGKLKAALHSLHKTLPCAANKLSCVIYENGSYRLNSQLNIWVDIEHFIEYTNNAYLFEKEGCIVNALQAYHSAVALYQDDLLAEDRDDDWLTATRQQLQDVYSDVLERLKDIYFTNQNYAACIPLCRQMLALKPCREDLHRLLIRCYNEQGQHQLAQRQYQHCVNILREKLGREPDSRTADMIEQFFTKKGNCSDDIFTRETLRV